MALHIYLIRHGRTEWNEQGLLQGWGDSPLVEKGILGAKRTGEALANIPFVACYSSLMKRAQDTAEIILGNRDIPHFHHKGLNELHFGNWEGKAIASLLNHPEYQQLREDPKNYFALESQGETIQQLYERITKTFWQIVARHENDQAILIISHGLALTLLTAVLKGIHWHDFRDPHKHEFIANTSINVVEVENNNARLVEFNHTQHLS